MKSTLLNRHHPLPIAGFSLREGLERFLRDSARLVSWSAARCVQVTGGRGVGGSAQTLTRVLGSLAASDPD